MATETKCWSCAKESFSKCPWVLFGQAVKGWKAEKTEIKNGSLQDSDRIIKSFSVIKCPNYVSENKVVKSENKAAKIEAIHSTKDHACKSCGKKA